MKRTVFEGIVNGEKFDSVQKYNERVNELMSSGEFKSASSSTRIEEYETQGFSQPEFTTDCTTPCTYETELVEIDEDLSFYPYHDEDDPHYLDLLATSDHETNLEAYAEATNRLEKCWNYIKETLDDKEVTNESRQEYLSDIRDILETLSNDADRTNVALDKIYEKREALDKEFTAAKHAYENNLKETYRDEEVLNAALNVINLFDNFYRDVEEEVVTSIKTPLCKCGKPVTECKTCNCDKVETSVKEAVPQKEISDFNKVFERIFGPLR